jgi:hypothetical protein
MVPNNPTWIWPEPVVAAARWPHIFSPILSAGNPRDGGVGCRQLAYYCTYLSTAVRSTRSCMCSFRSPDDVHHQPHTVLWRSSCSLSLSLASRPLDRTTGTGTGRCIGQGVHANKHTKLLPSTRLAADNADDYLRWTPHPDPHVIARRPRLPCPAS